VRRFGMIVYVPVLLKRVLMVTGLVTCVVMTAVLVTIEMGKPRPEGKGILGMIAAAAGDAIAKAPMAIA